MPARDPETGKFVSGSKQVHRDDGDTLLADLVAVIPAADLSGGTVRPKMEGEAAELVDFGNVLDSDEVFEVYRLSLMVTLSMPTTATAEGSAQADYTLTDDLTDFVGTTGTFYGSTPQRETDIIDIRVNQHDQDDWLVNGRLVAAPSVADSAAGLAAGSDNGIQLHNVPYLAYFGSGPRFDEDDEIGVPTQIAVDNVSDHAVQFTADLLIEGEIFEDC